MAETYDDGNDTKFNVRRKKIDNFDDVLPYVGDFGKYQWFLMIDRGYNNR